MHQCIRSSLHPSLLRKLTAMLFIGFKFRRRHRGGGLLTEFPQPRLASVRTSAARLLPGTSGGASISPAAPVPEAAGAGLRSVLTRVLNSHNTSRPPTSIPTPPTPPPLLPPP